MSIKTFLGKWTIEKLVRRLIVSLTDNDFYKFTQQYAVLVNFPNVRVRYRFINRRPEGRFSPEFAFVLSECIKAMADLRLTKSAMSHLERTCPFLPPHYLAYLANYRFKPEQVTCDVIDNELVLEVYGLWHETILWEVPLMALISGLYFLLIDKDWDESLADQWGRSKAKLLTLEQHGCLTSEFGTRRRRNLETQQIVVESWRGSPVFVGTSNVYLSEQLDMPPKGTIAHEYTQGVSAIMGLRHANRFALETWQRVYHGKLGIALPDTFGRAAFITDFTEEFAKLWDGVRHDSGNPFEFTEEFTKVYRGFAIDPLSKVILFSNNLSIPYCYNGKPFYPKVPAEDVTALQQYAKPRMLPRYGIGTFATNDFVKLNGLDKSNPLNMVIKLVEADDVPVVKLSDDPGKAMGDPCAIADAMWTFHNKKIEMIHG